jgi:hypothetical protein
MGRNGPVKKPAAKAVGWRGVGADRDDVDQTPLTITSPVWIACQRPPPLPLAFSAIQSKPNKRPQAAAQLRTVVECFLCPRAKQRRQGPGRGSFGEQSTRTPALGTRAPRQSAAPLGKTPVRRPQGQRRAGPRGVWRGVGWRRARAVLATGSQSQPRPLRPPPQAPAKHHKSVDGVVGS